MWTLGSEDLPKKSKRIELSVAEAERAFRATRLREAEGDKRFGKHALLDIYYEDLVSDTRGTFHKLTEFLNVPYVPPSTKLLKQNPEPLSELIVNYQDLKTAFMGTEWERFFNDSKRS
mgnify:CR=1 FL=1